MSKKFLEVNGLDVESEWELVVQFDKLNLVG